MASLGLGSSLHRGTVAGVQKYHEGGTQAVRTGDAQVIRDHDDMTLA